MRAFPTNDQKGTGVMISLNLRWGVCCGVIGYLLAGAEMRSLAQDPPFWGTVWVDPDIIKPTDWSAYQSMTYGGIAPRFVFDRRDDAFSTKPMHLFDATYADQFEIEVQVNSSDFDMSTAEAYAASYAEMVGRLPTSLRVDVETMWIHGGGALPFGGGNNNILVHVDVAATTVDFLEEILFHEATHTSYDSYHSMAPGWLAAQAADPTFISDYARDHPNREDMAETLLMWYALRHRSDRLDAATMAAIESAIPNRLAYLDALPFALLEPPLYGDYNDNGVVDAADYVRWRKASGTDILMANDETPGTGPDDYIRWRVQFGKISSSSFTTANVPEPSAFMMLLTGTLAALYFRRVVESRTACNRDMRVFQHTT